MHMEKEFKTKYEYCHIDNDKIVITKTPQIEDLVTDYAKSINDFFKTLMAFFIFIPVFTALSVVFYYIGNYGLSIYMGGGALVFLFLAFYSILFTSGSPVIYRNKIVKIQFKKTLLINSIVIHYKDFGRIKKRGIPLTNKQVEIDTALEILLSEKLIEEKNIEYKGKLIELYSYALSIILSIPLSYLFLYGNIINLQQGTKEGEAIKLIGIYLIIICTIILTSIFRKIVSSFFYKIKSQK